MPRSFELWTPVHNDGALTITVDKLFANACMRLTDLNDKDLKHFSEVVWKKATWNLGEMPTNFIEMFGGILPREFCLPHFTGFKLEADGATCEMRYPGRVTYESKNTDSMIQCVYLQQTFAAWANVAAERLEWF